MPSSPCPVLDIFLTFDEADSSRGLSRQRVVAAEEDKRDE
jgi:hypothetical protein